MKITSISLQTRNKNRVNIAVDGEYRFSLDVFQVLDLGVKVGQEYSETDLVALEYESQFGKLYGRALEYCLMRPRSQREVKDYLFRKTKPSPDKTGKMRSGAPVDQTVRVMDRLISKGYIDDQKFARFWIENHSLAKGASRRKLVAELRAKGIGSAIIEQLLAETVRNDTTEIQKIIAKKQVRYPDVKKLMAYLARQGFDYDDIKQALEELADKQA